MILSKKDYQSLYQPKNVPHVVEVPTLKFVTITGQGDPNGQGFATATEALFSFSYAVKMSYKKPEPPKGYYEYKVFPLEGEWDLIDHTKPSTDKSNYAFKIMIQQPDFLTSELFQYFISEVEKKKSNPLICHLNFEEISEGLVCQMLHQGPFDEEPASFKKMEDFCKNQGYVRLFKSHREIYLSDPRKVEPSKMKTILRFKVSNL